MKKTYPPQDEELTHDQAVMLAESFLGATAFTHMEPALETEEGGFWAIEWAQSAASDLAIAARSLAQVLRSDASEKLDLVHLLHRAHVTLVSAVGMGVPLMIDIVCHSEDLEQVASTAEKVAKDLDLFLHLIGEESDKKLVSIEKLISMTRKWQEDMETFGRARSCHDDLDMPPTENAG